MVSLRAVGLALLLAPVVAVAQPQPTPQQKQQASDKVKKAIAKSQAGDHDIAVELYLEAYAIIPQPLLLSNIGSEYQQIKKPVEAIKYFCKYLEADPMGANVSYATAQVRTLIVELGGVPPVDDKDVCRQPVMKPAPPPQPVPSVPANADLPPAASPAPTPGPVDQGPTTSTPAIRYAGIGVAVVGAAAVAGGAYFGLEARKISDEITNHNVNDPWPGDIKQREAEGKDAEKKQIALLIGGGVALAAGVVMIIAGAPKATAREATVSITPVATPDSLGFAAAGRF